MPYASFSSCIEAKDRFSYILNNRFYVGELHRNGQVFEGRYKRLIDRATFDACQDVMNGRNRRGGTPEHPLAGGLFRCTYCRQSITGERIRRRLKGGGVREHIYYRCANNHPGPDPPTVRWKADDLERAIVDDLAEMRLATPEIASWFRTELSAAVNELKAEAAKADEALAQLGDMAPARGQTALALFDWTQRAADIWRGSNSDVRREILDCVCLNRTLSDASLCLAKRKPFDILAEGPKIKNSCGDRI